MLLRRKERMNLMEEARKIQFYQVAFKDQETADKVSQMTAEQVVDFLAQNGQVFTLDEVKMIGKELNEKFEAYQKGELTDADLEDVAGGHCNHCFWKGVAVGSGIGAAVCFGMAAAV